MKSRSLSVIWNASQLTYERESGQISVPVIAEKNGIKWL